MTAQRFRPSILTRALVLGLCGSVSLSACSLVPTPTPDPALDTLYQRASADAVAAAAASASDPNDAASAEAARTRRGDAEELKAEIERLCGHYKDGSVPDSCEVPAVEEAATTGVDTSASATTQILDSIAQVPRESLGVVVPQFTVLATTGITLPAVHAADLSSATNTQVKKADLSDDVAALTEQLKQEYGAVYALGVALAFAGSDMRPAIQDAIAQHREITAVLEASVPEGAAAPSPEAGYTFPDYTQPHDADTATRFFRELVADRATAWSATASTAHAESWRYQSLIIAGLMAQETTK